MEKILRMKVTIGFLTLTSIGLLIGVIILAVEDNSEPESPSTTTTPIPSVTTTNPGTTVPTTIATTHVPGVITDDDLRHLSEELLKSDKNNMAKFVKVNVEANPDEGEKLLEVQEDALNCDTIQGLRNLFDNFKAPIDVDDNLDDENFMAEKEAFLDFVMESDIMKITEAWMIQQGMFDGLNLTLHDVVDQIWFMPYAGSHSSGIKDSTGFEHTFVGQMDGDEVKGLHNWVRFYELEQAGNITFVEFFNQTIFDGDHENKGSVLNISYDWEDASEESGKMFVGTSPELEMALYTVCYFARSNSKCPVQMNGKQFTITTMDYKDLNVIAVANPNI